MQIEVANIVANLQEDGLSGKEARVLVFLAKRGTSRASEVARAIQINRIEMYRTVKNEDELMLYERLPDDNNPDVGADMAFWTNSKRFIATMTRAYDALWKDVFSIYPSKRRGSRG
jgi:hypothetical protein